MAAFEWHRGMLASNITVNAGALPDDWLGHINTRVTANSGDANAFWEVANYASVSPKSVLLRPKDGSAGRIIFFGQNGGTPATNAVRNSTASLLYVAFSASSTSNTPDQSWLSGSGPPLTASDYMLGIPAWPMSASTTYRMWYVDSPAGMYFNITLGTTTSMGIASAGWLVEDYATGEYYPTIQGMGSTSLTSQPWTSQSLTTGPWPTTEMSNITAASEARCFIRYNNFNQSIQRLYSLTSTTAADKLRDSTNKRAFFFPCPMYFNWHDRRKSIAGKLRQVAFGPSTTKEAVLESTASPSVYAYGHSHDNTTARQAVWFTNFEV